MILPGIATPKLTFFFITPQNNISIWFQNPSTLHFFLIFECCVIWYQFVISLFSMSTLLQMIYDDIWSKSFHFKEKEVFCVLSDNHYHAMPGSDFSKWNNIIKNLRYIENGLSLLTLSNSTIGTKARISYIVGKNPRGKCDFQRLQCLPFKD